MINRRAAIGLMSSAPFLLGLRAQPLIAMSTTFDDVAKPHVAVIGAGIIGVSTAYHLARFGARVTLIDSNRPGQGATQGAFAMLIPVSEQADPELGRLYRNAVSDWHRMQVELPEIFDIQWGGMVAWYEPGEDAERLREHLALSIKRGAPVRTIGEPELLNLVPGVRPGPFGAGSFSPTGGTLNPSTTLSSWVNELERLGVDIQFPRAATGFQIENGAVTHVATSSGPLKVDAAVIAAGARVPDLGAMVETKAPLNLVSGVLAHTEPHERVLDRVLVGPFGTLKQDMDSRFVTGPNYTPGAAGRNTSEAYGKQLLEIASRYVPAMSDAKLDRMSIGFVPIPKDGRPTLGRSKVAPNAYVVSTMSGITMAPLLGRLAATELMLGIDVDDLTPFRPTRFDETES